MKSFRILPLAAVLLTGCTDIRARLLPDLLAADLGETVQLAAHSTEDDTLLSASAASPLLLPEVLENASGAEISTGHLTMLAVSGNPCALIEQYLQAQYLAPTCEVLSVPRSACRMLESGVLPAAEQIQAAVDTGMLPARTADTVIGDLWGGSGITALHTYQNGSLTLSLWDTQRQCTERLSPDACRGLALLGTRWKSFAFTAENETFRLQKAALRVQMQQLEEGLQITVCGSASAEPQLTAAAAARLREMLTAALEETALSCGADLLFLREIAVRDGIAAASGCSQEEWRLQLRSASLQTVLSDTP